MFFLCVFDHLHHSLSFLISKHCQLCTTAMLRNNLHAHHCISTLQEQRRLEDVQSQYSQPSLSPSPSLSTSVSVRVFPSCECEGMCAFVCVRESDREICVSCPGTFRKAICLYTESLTASNSIQLTYSHVDIHTRAFSIVRIRANLST